MRRGLAPSRDRAQREISAGRVLVRGVPATKAARMVDGDDPVALRGPAPRFVSRGGDKLDAALDHFCLDVAGRTALDAGASTGGFTDCLLQRGAAHVVAVDVGRGQLDMRLRADPRVTVRERTNVRSLAPDDLAPEHLAPENPGGGGAWHGFDLVVADLAFISLRTVAPALVALASAGADLVLLVKPQFEAGRVEASRERGVIRDPEVWAAAIRGVVDAYADLGAPARGLMVSPLRGAEGNVEFLAHLVAGAGAGGPDGSGVDAATMVAEVVATAAVRRIDDPAAVRRIDDTAAGSPEGS